jgi:hypothetical protein
MLTLFLLLVASLPGPNAAATDAPRQSRWWFQTHTPDYTKQALAIVAAHAESITGVLVSLPCLNLLASGQLNGLWGSSPKSTSLSISLVLLRRPHITRESILQTVCALTSPVDWSAIDTQ